jgi:hypothetical protein
MRRAEAGNYGDFGRKSGRKEEGAGGAAEQEGRKDAAGSEILPRTGKKNRGFQGITRLKELSPFSIGFEPIIPK